VHRFHELDGLRAFAILGVLYTHFINDESMVGTLGVELFFVLSGYLITGILLRGRNLIEACESTLPTVLKSFYIRRALRILPVYYFCLFCLWLAGSQEVKDQIWWHATFNSNMLFVFIPFTNLTPHFWTLAVEEQFYVFWPAIILLAPRRHLLTILLARLPSPQSIASSRDCVWGSPTMQLASSLSPVSIVWASEHCSPMLKMTIVTRGYS
jgi:peptidoglycan/LPS O-acetylase OafA/YrhL